MMEEKEKSKKGCFGWQIISLSALSTLIIVLWFLLYTNTPCGCSPPELTETIVTRNGIDLTQISSTSTAVAEQGE